VSWVLRNSLDKEYQERIRTKEDMCSTSGVTDFLHETQKYVFHFGVEFFQLSNQTCAAIRGRLPGIDSFLKKC
jgi:hypothetical protein